MSLITERKESDSVSFKSCSNTDFEDAVDEVSEDEYAVEDIVAKRVGVNGQTEYKVKWKGYVLMTWEPQRNLGNCKKKLEAFEKACKTENTESNNKHWSTTRVSKKSNSRLSKQAKCNTSRRSKMIRNEEKQRDDEGNNNDKTSRRTRPWIPQENKLEGFDKGFQPDKILEAGTTPSGETVFLMKWKDSDEVHLVRATVANLRCPQVVIAFYEERVIFIRDEGQQFAETNQE